MLLLNSEPSEELLIMFLSFSRQHTDKLELLEHTIVMGQLIINLLEQRIQINILHSTHPFLPLLLILLLSLSIPFLPLLPLIPLALHPIFPQLQIIQNSLHLPVQILLIQLILLPMKISTFVELFGEGVDVAVDYFL